MVILEIPAVERQGARAPGGLTIIALESDHFFTVDPDIDNKTVALAELILEYLEGQ